jgi:threonine aldolase
MGGGWRQAGVLAAAGLYAVDHHVDRLADDHENARVLAEILADSGAVDPADVETNVVMLDLSGLPVDTGGVVRRSREEGVLVSAVGPRLVRLITHLDVTADDCRKAGEMLSRLLGPRTT